MNMKYIYIISILVVTTIGIGCIGEQKLSNTPVTTSTPVSTSPKITSVVTPVVTPVVTEKLNMTINTTVTPTTTKVNVSTAMPNITSTVRPTETSTVIPTSMPTVKATNTPIKTSNGTSNDTNMSEPQTENLKIGDSKDILGINIKLVGIKIADGSNNSSEDDMATINVDGKRYDIPCYIDQEIKGRIINVYPDDSATSADITVDYATSGNI